MPGFPITVTFKLEVRLLVQKPEDIPNAVVRKGRRLRAEEVVLVKALLLLEVHPHSLAEKDHAGPHPPGHGIQAGLVERGANVPANGLQLAVLEEVCNGRRHEPRRQDDDPNDDHELDQGEAHSRLSLWRMGGGAVVRQTHMGQSFRFQVAMGKQAPFFVCPSAAWDQMSYPLP